LRKEENVAEESFKEKLNITARKRHSFIVMGS
jgi:hypothetical protein